MIATQSSKGQKVFTNLTQRSIVLAMSTSQQNNQYWFTGTNSWRYFAV